MKKNFNGYTITIEVERDDDHGAPWDENDGHGPVSEWRPKQSKRPGEVILHSDHGSYRFYDWQEAVKIAKRDGWGFLPGELETGRDDPDTMAGWARCGDYYAHDDKDFNNAISAVYAKHRATMTAKQYAEGAVKRDFEYLRRWCNDEWYYVGYTASIADEDGAPVKYDDSCWGFDAENYMLEEAFGNAERYIASLQTSESRNPANSPIRRIRGGGYGDAAKRERLLIKSALLVACIHKNNLKVRSTGLH